MSETHSCVAKLQSVVGAIGMGQGTAKRLFEEGAFLILLDVPEGTDFGMDWNSWVTGRRFKGVKMIPPGLHFVFYCANSKYGGSPRTGFYHFFKLQEILVCKWDSSREDIEFLDKSDDELSALECSLKDMDKNLAPYPYETLKKWVSLTDKITLELTEKFNPASGKIISVPELIPEKDMSYAPEMISNNIHPHKLLNSNRNRLPILKCKPGTEIKFSKVPIKWYPHGASPKEISRHSMDSSYIMEVILKEFSSPDDILGELQYCFITFILGQVLDGFEQWKGLIHILCSCNKSLSKYVSLYESLLTVLYHQINEIPNDFFVDIVTSNNFLVSALCTLFSNINGVDSGSSIIKARSKQFKKYLTKKFKWDFDCEPEDWAPVVVET